MRLSIVGTIPKKKVIVQSNRFHSPLGNHNEPKPRSKRRHNALEGRPIARHTNPVDGFEDKILALYARGMTTRDIQAQVQDLYGVEVSPTFISNITEAVMDEVRQ